MNYSFSSVFGFVVCLLFQFLSYAACQAEERIERLEDWATAAQGFPSDGWITFTVMMRSPDGKVHKEFTRKIVRSGKCFLVETIVPGKYTRSGVGHTLMHILNPSYVAKFRKSDNASWVLEELALYSDEGFQETRESWFNYDQLDVIRNYNGILSVLLSGQYSLISHENLDDSLDRYEIQVTDGPGIEEFSRGYSTIEYFTAEFSDESPLPIKVSGKFKDRKRFFSMSLSDWAEIDGQNIPMSQVAETDDKDHSTSVVAELTMDFSEFDDPVDSSIFYLKHYGFNEPKLKITYKTYLLYFVVGFVFLASTLWIVNSKLRK